MNDERLRKINDAKLRSHLQQKDRVEKGRQGNEGSRNNEGHEALMASAFATFPFRQMGNNSGFSSPSSISRLNFAKNAAGGEDSEILVHADASPRETVVGVFDTLFEQIEEKQWKEAMENFKSIVRRRKRTEADSTPRRTLAKYGHCRHIAIKATPAKTTTSTPAQRKRGHRRDSAMDTALVLLRVTASGSKNENILFQVPIHEACRWGAPVEFVKMMLDEFPDVAMVAKLDSGRLPLHEACDRWHEDASPPVVQQLLTAYPEAVSQVDNSGKLPLQIAASANAPLKVFTLLFDAYPEAAAQRDKEGLLPLHLLARRARYNHGEDVQKIELLLEPILCNEDACKTADSRNDMLPLHIAADFGVSLNMLRGLLATYGEAANATCSYTALNGERMRAFDILNMHYSEYLRCDEDIAKFEGKSDLLYTKSMNALDNDRNDRIVQRILHELNFGTSSLSDTYRSAFFEMCRYENKDNPDIDFFRCIRKICQSNALTASVQDENGDLAIHHVARRSCKTPVDFVELLLRAIMNNTDACEADGSVGVMLPLHVAAIFNVSLDIFEALLKSYPMAASRYHVRPGQRKKYSLEILQAQELKCDSCLDWRCDSCRKSDLLFAFHPNTSWCAKDSTRMKRLSGRVRDEATSETGLLSATSLKVWVWVCTHGQYEDIVGEILNGLPANAIQYLAYTKTPTGQPVLTGSTPACGRIIRSFLLFAGRYDVCETEKPLHKSATCIVLRGRDYLNTDAQDGGSDSHASRSVVIKFMQNKQQFDREKVSRKNVVDGKFPPVVGYQDDFNVDRGEDKDKKFHTSTQKFGQYCLENYRYALVMKEADRTLDDILKHEHPSLNEIRLIMEQVATAVGTLHQNNVVHGDIKSLNIVRLHGHMALIDLDSCCSCPGVGIEYGNCVPNFAGSKFSSGVLPPEMIHELEPGEEASFEMYWQDVLEDFHLVEQIRKESNPNMPDDISKWLARALPLRSDMNLADSFAPLSKQSHLLHQMIVEADSADVFFKKWMRTIANAALWEKIRPQASSKGKRFVIKTFGKCQNNRSDVLPYDLVPASVALDMWSLGVLFYKLCTGTPLFKISERTDDLATGDDLAEVSDWDLDKTSCQDKLKRVSNNLARDLLNRLLERSPERRLRGMSGVCGHDFFCADNSKAIKLLEAEICALKEKCKYLEDYQDRSYLKSIQDRLKEKEDELNRMIDAMCIKDLIRFRRWDSLIARVNRSPDAISQDVLHYSCKYAPTLEVIESLIHASSNAASVEETDRFGNLPIHVACSFGASTRVIQALYCVYPESLIRKNKLGKVPLDVAQSTSWTHHQETQFDAISFLRREQFKDYFDDMTGLPRRLAFDVWARLPPPGLREASALLLYIDISGFKGVNDTANHDAGDRAIRFYAKEIVRACDECAHFADKSLHLTIETFRTGGDEFVVVAKFASNMESARTLWNSTFEELAQQLASLRLDDTSVPPRYSTFLRIGCCAGSVARMDDLLEMAEELQSDIRERIGLERGGSVSLDEIQVSNISGLHEIR